MMGDQQNEGVIPKAVGEIFDYVEKVLTKKLDNMGCAQPTRPVPNSRFCQLYPKFWIYQLS